MPKRRISGGSSWHRSGNCLSQTSRDGVLWWRRIHSSALVGQWHGIYSRWGDGNQEEIGKNVLRVDTGCLVAFTSGVDYDIERAGNLKSMFFGGEGFFLATLRGTGTVLLQSLPFSRMADRILEHAPSAGGSRKGEGSLLGKFGGMLDGN